MPNRDFDSPDSVLYTAAGLRSNDRAMNDLDTLQERLATLRLEHRDLDDVIRRLGDATPFDELQLRRLKKRKLALKDQIMALESVIVPDIIA